MQFEMYEKYKKSKFLEIPKFLDHEIRMTKKPTNGVLVFSIGYFDFILKQKEMVASRIPLVFVFYERFACLIFSFLDCANLTMIKFDFIDQFNC